MAQPAQGKSASRLRTGCGIAAAVFIVLLLLVPVAVYVWLSGIRKDLEAKQAQFREQGYPVTLDELQSYYGTLPDDQNAALIYQQVFDAFEKADPGYAKWEAAFDPLVGYQPGEEVPEGFLQTARQYVQDMQEPLRLLHQAATLGEARFPLDFGQGMAVELPHLAPLRHCSRSAALASEVAAIDRDPATAIGYLTDCLRVSYAMRSDPCIIPQLVRVACGAIAAQSLGRTVSWGDLPQDQLLCLQEEFARAEFDNGMLRALAGEHCMAEAALWELGDGRMTTNDLLEVARMRGAPVPPRENTPRVRVPVSLARLAIEREVLAMYDVAGSWMAMQSEAWPARVAAQARVAEYQEERLRLHPLAEIATPSYEGAALTFARDAAALRCAQAVCAVERYRQRYLHLPPSLDALVPEFVEAVPEDPYDGQPLRYRILDPGYVVYSVHTDLDDDGGRELTKATMEDCDWPLRVWR